MIPASTTRRGRATANGTEHVSARTMSARRRATPLGLLAAVQPAAAFLPGQIPLDPATGELVADRGDQPRSA